MYSLTGCITWKLCYSCNSHPTLKLQRQTIRSKPPSLRQAITLAKLSAPGDISRLGYFHRVNTSPGIIDAKNYKNASGTTNDFSHGHCLEQRNMSFSCRGIGSLFPTDTMLACLHRRVTGRFDRAFKGFPIGYRSKHY